MKYYNDKWNDKIIEEDNDSNELELLEEFNKLVEAARKNGLNKEQTIRFLESFGFKNGEFSKYETDELSK